MVNGWCFGGAFTPLVACDLAIAAEEAQFGVSEINWGIIPAGNVTRALAATMNQRDAMYYVMTGSTFDGRKAAQMGVVNEAVPLASCAARTKALATSCSARTRQCCAPARPRCGTCRTWRGNCPTNTCRRSNEQLRFLDAEAGRAKGLTQFLDEKSFRPGLGGYRRDE